MSAKKLTRLSFFLCLSLLLYYIESLLPPFLPIPGAKLGLANLITLLVIQFFSFKEAALLLFLRILLVSLLFGQGLSFLYSLTGGLFCLFILLVLQALPGKIHPILLGIFGGLFHNLGQFNVALFLTKVSALFLYLPYLFLCGILAGALTGFITLLLLPPLRRAWKE